MSLLGKKNQQPDLSESQQKNSSRNFFVRVIIAGTTLFVSFTTYFSYQIVKNLILENLRDKAFLEVQEGVNEIDSWLSNKKASLEAIANNPTFRTMEWSQIKPYLQAEEKRLSKFMYLGMIDADAFLYTTVEGEPSGVINLQDREHVQEALNKGVTTLSDPIIARIPKGKRIVAFEAAVFSGIPEPEKPLGKVIGLVDAVVDIEKVIDVVNSLEYGEQSYAFALNSKGEAIVHPDSKLMSTLEKPAPSLLNSSDPGLAVIAQQMVAKQQRIQLTKIDGIFQYVAYLPLKEANWSVALVIPRENIEFQLRPLNIIAVVVIALATMMMIILWQIQSFEQKQLKKSKQVAETANQAKSEFLSNMSHELRTPLNGILGYAQILQRDRNFTPTQKNALSIIHNSGNHLLTLINDILDLSRIEARKMEIYPSEIHFISFLESIVGIIKMRALEKDILFKYELEPHLPTGINADEKRLRQVLLNLLGNAVKFTDNGQVTFNVRQIENQTDMTTIQFEIIDTGVGMTAQDLEKIFQPFEQVGDTKHRQQGTGLGLTITKQLVELMGSKLKVKSEFSKGSTFWFEVNLPTVNTSIETIDEPIGRIIGYQGTKRQILVVDDKQENLLVLQNMLEPLGFEIILGVNGQEEIDLAQKFQPDLILTDLVMPVKNGVEAIQAIRSLPEVKNIPIIVVSASVLDMDKKQSKIAGCNDFLSKPVDENKLLSLLGEYLKLDWIYEEEVGEEELDRNNISLSEKLESIIPPPPEEMEILYEFAMLGSMRKIQERAAYLEELDQKYIPFAQHLKNLAQEFRDKEITDFVEKYLYQDSQE
ncbi:MAG: response regulator [Okeania sp. SIO3I5]|uniref:hybrid sensor histidine kinase/response regulator n=1 Tax=Okeania sp. SIO3I5 TaxID=2607805 RepID=UPI0013BC80DF|nr:hybrid sensor histidine kinase/response regulator [Okeania sp. SIO3I5]NEQ41385.1 response regulator [Okeania sp. SIO3I5]